MYLGLLSFLFLLLFNTSIQSFSINAWVPYWLVESGAESAQKRSDIVDQISPFALDVDKHGGIINHMIKKQTAWDSLLDHYRKKKKRIVPTLHWGDTEAMHTILSNKKRRKTHIDAIMRTLQENNFDGINIDYEKVCSHDREHYLLFLEKLSTLLHNKNKVLYLTIGGRTSDDTIRILPAHHKKHGHTPLSKHKYKHPHKVHASLSPGKGEVAQRYKRILSTCCDQIIIIGYDEWGKAYKHYKNALDEKYYVSLASDLWNEQIIKYALTYIPKNKLLLGIATYGLEFAILHHPNRITFKKRRSLTYQKALDVAELHKKTPQRTAGGELCFSYYTPAREELYVCFMDGEAIKQKIELAKKYGIKGVYLFTVNGLEDPALWKVLNQKNKKIQTKQNK